MSPLFWYLIGEPVRPIRVGDADCCGVARGDRHRLGEDCTTWQKSENEILSADVSKMCLTSFLDKSKFISLTPCCNSDMEMVPSPLLSNFLNMFFAEPYLNVKLLTISSRTESNFCCFFFSDSMLLAMVDDDGVCGELAGAWFIFLKSNSFSLLCEV